MLATFIGKQMLNKSLEESLIYATAIGSSTAFSKGLSDLKDIPKLVKEVSIKNIRGE